ncbi:hypothetical protein [Mesorhizobium sp.]|uniref:hypothetical protein n=1 Tax=Mesorhizobium sp. TaxID=1871066 RepID=UPI00257FDF03|nr:hypothetical protein [Mesorhizobium sp.]
MATAVAVAEQSGANELSRDECFGLMLDREIATRAEKRVRNKIAQAALPLSMHRRPRLRARARPRPPQHHGASRPRRI